SLSRRNGNADIFFEPRPAHVGFYKEHSPFYSRSERGRDIDRRQRLSLRSGRTGDHDDLEIRGFALLPDLEREQTILFSRHRLRLRNDHRILRSAALAAFDSLNVRNDAEDWQARERLEVINRTESRIVLLQDECQNKAQSKFSAKAHQYEPRALRAVWPGGTASAFDDWERKVCVGRCESARMLRIQMFCV